MIVEKDLATSRAEFFRNLAVALKAMPHTVNGDSITAGEGEKTIELTLSPLPPRTLSPLLKMERWKLKIEFKNYTQQDQQSFLTKFDRAFQRGGG